MRLQDRNNLTTGTIGAEPGAESTRLQAMFLGVQHAGDDRCF